MNRRNPQQVDKNFFGEEQLNANSIQYKSGQCEVQNGYGTVSGQKAVPQVHRFFCF